VAAAGKFPGGFTSARGGPPSRKTHRPAHGPPHPAALARRVKDEVQVQAFVMASDRQNDGDVLAMNGASAALRVSPLPFQGPIASIRLGYIDGQFVPFPTHDAWSRATWT